MAETDPKVMSMVEAALKKNPDASSQELYDEIKKKKRSLGKLTLRQFHARYPLQVKRREGLKSRAKSGSKKSTRKKATRAKAPARKKAMTRKRRAPRARTASAASVTAAASGSTNRDAMRAVLLEFATDLAAADSREGAVRVVADVDRYVEKMAAAV